MTSWAGRYVLTGLVKRFDNAVKYALARVADGSSRGESICLGAKGDGVDFATTKPELGADIVAPRLWLAPARP